MDSHTHSAFGRLEVVETGRRRRWSEDEKARIVLESLSGPRLVSATARRHGISRAQLLAWRRTLRPEQSEAEPVPGRGRAAGVHGGGQMFARRRPSRRPFPARLPRERVVIAPPQTCPAAA